MVPVMDLQNFSSLIGFSEWQRPNSSFYVLQIRGTAENILPLHSHCVQQEQNKSVLRVLNEREKVLEQAHVAGRHAKRMK